MSFFSEEGRRKKKFLIDLSLNEGGVDFHSPARVGQVGGMGARLGSSP